MFRCATPAGELPAFARRAEAAGFDELWVVEDCFYSGGVAAAAAALAATARVRVGIGILPAAARNAESAESAGRLPTSSSSLSTRGAIAASFPVRFRLGRGPG